MKIGEILASFKVLPRGTGQVTLLACLMLHWPTPTVYRLQHVLRFVPMRIPKNTRRLVIHLVSVGKGLDFVPLYVHPLFH